MPDDPQNNEDEDVFEDDDDSEFELALEPDASDLEPDLSADLDRDKTLKDLHGKNELIADLTSTPNDFTDILIRRGIIDPAKLEEAKSVAKQTSANSRMPSSNSATPRPRRS